MASDWWLVAAMPVPASKATRVVVVVVVVVVVFLTPPPRPTGSPILYLTRSNGAWFDA